MKYPFTDKAPSLSEAVTFIAETAYPDEQLSATKKRIRSRIKYAIKKGKLPNELSRDKRRIDAGALFTWAVGEWAVLSTVEGLPLKVNIASGELTLPSIVASGEGFSVPADPENLKAVFIETMTELMHVKAELASLRNQKEILIQELNFWRGKDRVKRETGRDSGNRARGIPKKR